MNNNNNSQPTQLIISNIDNQHVLNRIQSDSKQNIQQYQHMHQHNQNFIINTHSNVEERGAISITIMQNNGAIIKQKYKQDWIPSQRKMQNNGQRHNIHFLNNAPNIITQGNELSNRTSLANNNMPVNRFGQVSHMSHIEGSKKLNHYKSLNNMRTITQESLAPSQKTIIFKTNNNKNLDNIHTESHLSTQTNPIKQLGQIRIHYNQINEKANIHDNKHQIGNLQYHPQQDLNNQRKHYMFNSHSPTNKIPQKPQNPHQFTINNILNDRPASKTSPNQTVFWRSKYQQLLKEFELLKSQSIKQEEMNFIKMNQLQKHRVLIQENFNNLRHQYDIIVQKNRIYSLRLQQLQKQGQIKNQFQKYRIQNQKLINQLMLQTKITQKLKIDLTQRVNKTTQEIQQLRHENEELKHNNYLNIQLQKMHNGLNQQTQYYKAELQQKILLANLLKKQNIQLNQKYNILSSNFQEITNNYNQLLINNEQLQNFAVSINAQKQQLHKQIISLQQNQFKFNHNNNNQQSYIQESQHIEIQETQQINVNNKLIIPKNNVSQIISIRSRNDSNDNSSKIMDLEIHVSKLKTQIKIKQQTYERQLKMANLSILQLINKIKAIHSEKDQIIKNLQERLSIVQTQLFKKDSLVRGLRDEISNHNHQTKSDKKNSIILSGSRHQLGQIQKQEQYKKELQNVRKSLFQKQRQKLILMQKYQQLEYKANENEEMLNKKKIENQNIRRQLNEFDNLQHENEKLLEMIHKKNEQILEMKMMVTQKDNHSGQYDALNQENEKLRELMIKKNEEISEIAEKLFNEQRKMRELQQEFNRRLEEDDEEIQRLQQILNKKDQQMNSLAEQFHQVQFQFQQSKNIITEYQKAHITDAQKIQKFDQYFQSIEEQIKHYEQQIAFLNEKIKQSYEELTNKIKLYNQALTNIDFLNIQVSKYKQQLSTVDEDNNQFKALLTKQFQHRSAQLQNKYKEMDVFLRQKQIKLCKSEQEMQNMIASLKKHSNCQKQIEKLTSKVKQYELKILNMIVNRNHSRHSNYQSQQIFQNKLIYQLKAQNQKLRQLPQTQKNYNSNEQLNNRLHKFNQKLTEAISDQDRKSRKDSRIHVDWQKERDQKRQSSNQFIQQYQNQKINLNYDQQINIKDTFCEFENNEIVSILHQRLKFYQQKNLQLEENNANHIKNNKKLKQMMSKMSFQGVQQIKQYYEAQIILLNNQITQLKQTKSFQKHEQSYQQSNSYAYKDVERQQQAIETKKDVSQEKDYNYSLKKHNYLH